MEHPAASPNKPAPLRSLPQAALPPRPTAEAEADLQAPFVSANPLPFLAAVLSLALGGMALWRIFMVVGPHAPALAWLAAVCSLVAFLVATFTWGKERLGQWAGPLAALLVELWLVNVLASFAVAGDTRFFTLFLVICVGAAGWLLEPKWFFLTWVVGASLWLSIAMFAGRPWEQQLGRVAGGFALSCLLLITKQFVWRRLQSFNREEETERLELEAARTALREARADRQRLEAELARTHARQERLALAAGEMISEHDAEGGFLYSTPGCKQLFGLTPTELQGRGLTEFVHRDDLATVQAARRSILELKEPQTVTHRVRRLDGAYLWVETTLRPVKLSEVKPVLHFTATLRDVTPLRDLEADWLAAEKEQQKLEGQLAAAEADQHKLEANWKAADAAMRQSQQLRHTAEEERRKEAQARAQAEAARLELQIEIEALRAKPPVIVTVPVAAPTVTPPAVAAADEDEWIEEVDRLTAEKRRLELDRDEQQHGRQRAEERQRAAEERQRVAEEALRATEAALRKLEAELRAAKNDAAQMETEWQDCDAKRQQLDKERQRLKTQLAAQEQELEAARAETEQQRQDAGALRQEAAEQRRQLEQLRRSLQEANQKRGKQGQERHVELEQTLAMLRELPVLVLLWDHEGKLRHVAGGGLELLGWHLDQPLQIRVEALSAGAEPLSEPLRSVLADQDYSVEVEQNDRLLNVRCTPWKNEVGEVRGLLGLVSDQTALRRVEGRLKQEKEKNKRQKEKGGDDRRTPSSGNVNLGPTVRLLPYEGDEEPAPEGPLPRFAGKALLIDDRREPQRVLTFLLERLGLQVELADFADQAEDLAVAGRHDVLLFARAMLRKESKLPHKLRERGVAAPMLALLEAEASASQETWCKEAGCDAVLRLPLTPAKLGEALANYLGEAEPEGDEAEAEPLLSRNRQDPAFNPLIRSFVEELPGKLAELWSALCVADLAQVMKGVHQLKEAASLYGYPELALQAGRLEQAIMDGQAAAALRTYLKELEKVARRCERGLAA